MGNALKQEESPPAGGRRRPRVGQRQGTARGWTLALQGAARRRAA